ncbi:flagellar motor protein MotB [Acuticoccus sediminis]|uniref:Flagellar motor protein MotB n=2 Tax=Acuticoccus sediminis TaxID=2184697 RepID=A0A8B2NJT1_9HYPH|nr:OmpA family protein [Acuticoccus sediminis]RAH99884.1 flagellar motor protein MotB [Acuticoccus sediminis]
MKTIALSAAVAAGLLASQGGAFAQNQLTRNQIVNSLYETEGTVARLDPIALEAAAQRAAASGGDNAPGPLSDKLAGLPQISVEINFDRGSARIRPESYYSVGLIADALHTPYLMGQKFVVIGHTDATGGRELNFKLSQQRAIAVMKALVTTFSVPTEQLVAIGLGEEQLQNPSDPYGAENRRVQLINIGQ